MKKVHLETYGCSLNQADSQRIKGILKQEGFEFTEDIDRADIVILNTCAVKHQTEQRMLHKIRNLKDRNLVICGCLPRINKKAVKKITDAPLVDTNSLYNLSEAIKSGEDQFSEEHDNKLRMPCEREGLVSTIPVAEGCVGNCAFCGTKNARGNITSYSVKDVLNSVKDSVEEGAKEIRLTAEDTGCYGIDIGTNLIELLKEISRLKGDFRTRIGMMNPEKAFEFKQELLEVLSSDKFYNFLHVPVQSGSEKILKKMRRSHGTKEFTEVAEAFKERFPFGSVSTDIIIGFPGETEKDFKETLQMIRGVRPDIINISKFFPRPDTEAEDMKKVPTKRTAKRSKELSKVCRQIVIKRNERLVGKKLDTVILGRGKKGGFYGRTSGYKKLFLDDARPGERVRVEIVSAMPGGLKAQKI